MQKPSFMTSIPFSLLATLGIIAGILSCYFLYESSNFTIISSLVLYGLISAGLFLSYQVPHLTKLYGGVVLALMAGFTRFHWQLHAFNSFDYAQFKKPVTIIARATHISHSSNSRLNQCFCFNIDAIKRENTTDAFYATKNSIMLYTRGITDIQVDDIVELRNITLKLIENKKFATYLMKEGYVSTIFTEKLDHTILSRPTYSWYRWVHTYRAHLFESIKKKCSPLTFTYFASLFLGERATNKKSLDQESEHFKYWGISHYLARSGLHMVIFVFVWQFLLKPIPLSYVFKEIVLFLLGIIYYLFSWSSISFIRAFAIFSFYKWCNVTGRVSHFLHILSLTACLVLLYNPFYLFFLDFQLSFLLTFALAWLATHR